MSSHQELFLFFFFLNSKLGFITCLQNSVISVSTRYCYNLQNSMISIYTRCEMNEIHIYYFSNYVDSCLVVYTEYIMC